MPVAHATPIVSSDIQVQGCKEAKLHGALRGLHKMGTF